MSQFDKAVAHTIKHFELHRIGGLEWRVISDIEDGVVAITAVEEAVLRRFQRLPGWPHTVVTFFVLQDLSALQRQLQARDAAVHGGQMMLPAGGIAGLMQRPVVNLYDLANPEACHIFINQAAMVQARYWGDVQAETALLAHEHAHPLVENATVQASRQVSIAVQLSSHSPLSTTAHERWLARLQEVARSLAERLCTFAPRELFTNSLVIAAGFDDALCYLDRMTAARAVEGLPGRQALVAGLRAEDELTDAGRNVFLLLADMQAHLEMAFEVAAFRWRGAVQCADALEQFLGAELFSLLTPEIRPIFAALTRIYVGLPNDLAPAQYADVVRSILAVVAEALASYGVAMHSTVVTIAEKEG